MSFNNENINNCNSQIISSNKDLTIITNKPSFIDNDYVINVWNSLIIDPKTSILYENEHIQTKTNNHTIVISLLNWNELANHSSTSYIRNVQKSGKIFLHFPINPFLSFDNNIYLNQQYGMYTSLSEMKSIAHIITKYIKGGDKILLYSRYDKGRSLLLVACCMIYNGVDIFEVTELLNKIGLSIEYHSYLITFSSFCIESTQND